MIGQTLDRYRIEAKLGEGGMGVVYRARDTQLDRIVAIKVLPSDKVADAERKQRFVYEARSVSALNHPGIVTIHDIGSDSGVDFIVMEYVAGRTLDRLIPAAGLGITRALRFGAQIADALARAHEAGIVHRDLKPANVIVTDEDRVKVLDFGLAKLVEPVEHVAEAPTRTSPLTDAGTIVGTTAYMSPEQAEGRRVDGRSDIFSFGVILYEMLTGRRPFTGDSNLSVLSKIVGDDPAPPSAVNPLIPSDVDRAILRCLRKDPARRYQTMADLKVALEDLATDSTATQRVLVPAVRRSRMWTWGVVALVPIVLAGAYFAVVRMRVPAAVTATLTAVPLTSLPGVEQSPSFSADGNQVAFAWDGPGQDNPDIYVQQIGSGVPLRLTTDPANDYSPQWSPDGKVIAFLRQHAEPRRHELRLIPPLGGPERKLADIRPRGFLRAVTLAWCPDSSCVVLTDSPGDGQPDALFVVSVESGEKRQLTSPASSYIADTDPAVSPDGRWLVFRRDTAPFSGQLLLVSIDGDLQVTGEPRSLTPTLLMAYAPQWISNTDVIFSAKGSLWRTGISDDAAPERLPFVGQDGQAPALSRVLSGQPMRLAYVRSYRDTNIWRLDTPAAGAPAASPPTLAVSSTQHDGVPQLSTDRRKVTFDSNRSGENEIWAADVSGANAVQLTSLGANPGYASWSPDGSLVAFHSNSEAQASGNIFVVPAESGRPRSLTSHSSTNIMPRFSRDGRWIYFASTRAGAFSIWKIAVDGGEPVQVTKTAGIRPIESPDGTSLYYVETLRTDQPGPLWRQPLDGGAPVKLIDQVQVAFFDVVDAGVYYIERAEGNSRLRFFETATGRSTVVAERLGNLGNGLSASRDGRTILFSRVDSQVDDLMVVENFR